MDFLIFIKTNKKISLLRFKNRFVCPECYTPYEVVNYRVNKVKCKYCNKFLIKRDDDKLDIILYRLKDYEKHEQRLLSFFKNKKTKIILLDFEFKIEDITLKQIEEWRKIKINQKKTMFIR